MMEFLKYCDTYMPLLCLIVFLCKYQDISKKEGVLLIYLVISVVLFGISNWMADRRMNNMFLYHLISLLEPVIVILYLTIRIAGRHYRSFFWVAGAYSLFWLADIIWIEKLNVFNSYTAAISNIVIMGYCMVYIYQLSKSDRILYFQKLPSFWIISGFLLYSSISALVFISYRSFSSPDIRIKIWLISAVATIIKFVLISVGLLCYRRPSTSYQS
jgi:hypothetical protein